MGYFRGIVDDVLGRFVEAFLALPLVVTGVIALSTLGRSNLVLIVVIGLLFTPLIARTVRAAVLLERELDYVAAARLRGERAPYIMFVEILPNVFAPIMVEFTVRLGYAIFAILTLTFLGLGVQPPSPDWALDISANYGVVPAGYWWEVLFDAVAIATLVVSINLISDSVAGGARGMSAAADTVRRHDTVHRPTRSTSRTSRSPIACAGVDRAWCATSRFRSEGASRSGSSESRAAASRRSRSGSSVTSRGTGTSPAERSRSTAATCSR